MLVRRGKNGPGFRHLDPFPHLDQLSLPALVPEREQVALADFPMEHAVDPKEDWPKQDRRTVHRIKAAIKHIAEVKIILARPKAAPLQSLWAHIFRLKGNNVEAVRVIQPPFFVKKAIFLFQASIKRRAGKRNQVIEGGQIKFLLQCELEGGLETGFVILVISKYKGGIDADLVLAQICQPDFIGAFHQVGTFIHRFKIVRVERLETDQDAETPAGRQ